MFSCVAMSRQMTKPTVQIGLSLLHLLAPSLIHPRNSAGRLISVVR